MRNAACLKCRSRLSGPAWPVGRLCAWLLAMSVSLLLRPGGSAAQGAPDRPPATRDAPSAEEMRKRAERAAQKGQALYNQGRYPEALREFQVALAICRKHPFPDPYYGVRRLTDVALCLYRTGRGKQALAKAKETWEQCKRLGGEDKHPDVGRALTALAHCLRVTGKRTEALTQAKEALRILLARHGRRDHAAVAAAHCALARCLLADERGEEALRHAEAACAMNRRLYKAADCAPAARGLSLLSRCLRKAARPIEAVRQGEAGLAMNERLHKAHDCVDVAFSLNSVGSCLIDVGRPREAVTQFEQALRTYRKLHKTPDHGDIAETLGWSVLALEKLGRYAEALARAKEAAEMRQRLSTGPDDPDVALALNNVAGCLFRLGRLDEARKQFEAVLAMRRRIHKGRAHPSVARVLNNLGVCLHNLSRLDKAFSAHKEAYEMQRKLYKDRDHPALVYSLNNLAVAKQDLGQRAEALTFYEAAAGMLRRIYRGQAHPDLAICLQNAAMCLTGLGRPKKALRYYQEALAMGEGLSSASYATAASNLGWLYLKHLDEPAKAAEAFAKAVDSAERARLAAGGSDLDRAKFFASLCRRVPAFEGMLRAQLRLGRPDKALEYVERGRALTLRDILERGKHLRGGDLLGIVESAARARNDQALLRKVADVRQKERQADEQVATLTVQIDAVRARSDLPEDERGRRIRELEAQLDQARKEHLSARSAIFTLASTHAAQDLKPLTARQIQALLSGTQRLLVYSISSEYSVVLVVPPLGRKIQSYRLKWPGGLSVKAKALDEAVRHYVGAMMREGEAARGVRRTRPRTTGPVLHAWDGYRLFRTLVPAELWRQLRSAERVYIVPDGALHRLAFETLIVERADPEAASAKERRYWLDAGPPLVYGPSATVLVNRRRARDEQLRRSSRRGPGGGRAVLLGDPVFSRKAGPAVPVPAQGVVVMSVKPGSAARRLGLHRGAVITRYGPHEITGVERLDAAFEDLFRRMRRKELKTTPKLSFWLHGATFARELSPREELGARLADLTEPIRDRLKGGQPLDESLRVAMVERSGHLTRFGPLTPLPGTREEVREIYRTLVGRNHEESAPGGPVAVLLGEDATRTRLFAAAPGSRYLHLATHGLVDTSDKTIYSSLALTQPKVATREDFGFLRLVDLLDNWWGRLGATELVVLSACDTQRGRIEAGEGVFGISWGFMYAGAPAVIASLWQVSDESTAEMMGGLYARISKLSEAAGPLARSAKLNAFVEARKALRRKYPEPYFWAPFIYIGDPR